MSGPLAVAATSAVLRELLTSGLMAMDLEAVLEAGRFDVTLLAPDLIPRPAEPEDPRLNLFLFGAQRNAAWAGQGLPTRDRHSQRVANPILALDLHYLVSAYGGRDLEAEVLLGAALQVLHDTPGLDRQFIRLALTQPPPRVPAQLQEAGLAEQFETLRIAPLPLPSEEIARLWSALQTPYRPSAAFLVTVLLLESAHSTRQSLPVRTRVFRAQPIRALRIDRVRAATGPRDPITAGTRVRLEGRNLGAVDLQVWVNGIDLSAAIVSRSEQALEFDFRLPQPVPQPPALAPGLRAGAAGVQVVQPTLLGLPPLPHEGVVSNIAGFVLAPTITPVQPPPAAGTLRIDCEPPVGRAQRVRLLLNEIVAAPGAVPRSFSLAAPSSNGVQAPALETPRIDFDASAVPAGRYLARLQVDAAQSPLSTDADGVYVGPEVQL